MTTCLVLIEYKFALGSLSSECKLAFESQDEWMWGCIGKLRRGNAGATRSQDRGISHLLLLECMIKRQFKSPSECINPRICKRTWSQIYCFPLRLHQSSHVNANIFYELTRLCERSDLASAQARAHSLALLRWFTRLWGVRIYSPQPTEWSPHHDTPPENTPKPPVPASYGSRASPHIWSERCGVFTVRAELYCLWQLMNNLPTLLTLIFCRWLALSLLQ